MDPAVTKDLTPLSPSGATITSPTRMMGLVAVAGLVVVLLALAGFTYITTITAKSAANAVRAASQVDTAFQDVRHAADVEVGFQDSYWRETHTQVRGQFDQAALTLDDALDRVAIAAPRSPDGAIVELAAVRSLRGLQAKTRAAFTELADAIDAGDRERADAIDISILDPLHAAIASQVAAAVAHNQAEVADTLADLNEAADTSRSAIFIGGPLGLVLVAGCGLVLGIYRRRLDAATRLEIDHLLRDAMTDALTGLGNHRAFQEAFVGAATAALADGTPLSLVLVDLDDFKSINDRHGHKHGDRVLAAVGALLGHGYSEDRAFRLGGDEFALLLSGTTLARAVAAMERRQSDGATRLFGATLSIGIAVGVGGELDADTLREEADAALYEAKRRGRNQMVTFEEIQSTTTIMSSAKIRAVRRLLAEDAMSIAFQPIWDLERSTVLAVEALARPDPRLGLEGPGEAFAIAEKLGRAHELDALCHRAILARATEIPAGALLFINVVPQSLEHDVGMALKFARAVEASGLLPGRVVIEITERSVSRLDTVVRAATALHAAGFRLALDDVGSGNAGLEMLRRLPVDFVKIDQSVVKGAATETAARSVLAAIIAFAREAEVFVIAEGIETQAMLEFVRHVGTAAVPTHGGIQGAQGYLLGRPSVVHGDAGTGSLALLERSRG